MNIQRVRDHETSVWVECYLVPSQSDPNRSYVVSKKRDGTWACSCPRWIFKREDCKHIHELKWYLSSTTTPVPTIEYIEVPEKLRKQLSRFALVEVD
jgi:predicted nucleic acid-binding Zn finger protein